MCYIRVSSHTLNENLIFVETYHLRLTMQKRFFFSVFQDKIVFFFKIKVYLQVKPNLKVFQKIF